MNFTGNPKERRSEMRNYEIVFIVHPELEENSFNDTVTRVKGWITENDGSITKEEIWGRKRMAYAIRKQHEGQYVLLNAQMAPAFVTELERNFRITEPIMRYLVIALDE
jgi:small subunit ribosomal protein S6